jgi:hypothetical protein
MQSIQSIDLVGQTFRRPSCCAGPPPEREEMGSQIQIRDTQESLVRHDALISALYARMNQTMKWRFTHKRVLLAHQERTDSLRLFLKYQQVFVEFLH